jgi:hypothetical protein
MADTVLRLRILQALTAALKEITPANGYVHDLSSGVFRGRNVFGDTDNPPFVSILEAPDPIAPYTSPSDSAGQKGNWALIIQGFVEDDEDNPTDPAYVLIADVIKRLAIEKKRDADFDIFGMGNHVTGMEIGSRVVRPPDDTSSKAYFVLSLFLTVVESHENPYED